MGDGPLTLAGAQREIRDAYFDHDAGLFTLDCVPGSGKSVVASHVAAEDVLRRYVDGDRTPEQHVAVVSFNRHEAADIVPEICTRLRELVERDLVPAAVDVTEDELAYLTQRVRRAPYVGTVDSLLRDVFEAIAGHVGFSELPTVGNDALLKRVHAACYEMVGSDPTHHERVERLEAAYPTAEYEDDVADVLERAVAYCRDRRLSTGAFRDELERTRDAVYEGRPASFDDILAAIDRCVGADVGERVRDGIGDEDRDRLADADRQLYDEWGRCIGDFCTVLATYREAYRTTIREAGVVSHTDVASLVDAYFDGRVDGTDAERRTTLRERYRARIRSLIVDEAQDVSAIQHAALSHFVTPDTRVFAAGDVLQSIYRWRHADPTLFDTATTDGEYLGVDWDTHESRAATRTYRCSPDVAAAVNAVAAPVLTDPARGAIGDLDGAYPRLVSTREPTDDPSVHVAAFDAPTPYPGSYAWIDPENGGGEANRLATYLSRGLADGTFTDDEDDPLGITVLFRRRSRMDAYEDALVEEGLRVWNASDHLFDCPAVETVLDVCEWLVDPGDPARTRSLLTGSGLRLGERLDTFDAHGWTLGAVLRDADLADAERRVLRGLRELEERRDAFRIRPAASYVEDVIEALALRADPHGCVPDVDPAQRVANLDALTETVAEWEGDERYDPRELTDLVAPFRTNPREGPTQPSTVDGDHDVAFRTVHGMKGDEDDVVVLADLGFDIWSQGPHTQRFVSQGDVGGLAPPTNADVPDDVSLPPFDGGLYDPDDDRRRDVGLRWATAHWRDAVTETEDRTGLVGPDRLQRIAANERAEAWRLLYVALTRTRDHLVVPLPTSLLGDDRPRDRWLDAVRDGLRFDGQGRGTYTLATDDDPNVPSVDVGVNDVDLFAQLDVDDPSPHPDVATSPPRRDQLRPWMPRFVDPSTMYPLTGWPDEYVLDHLLGRALHTDTYEVPDDLPLRFDRLGPDAVGTCLHDVLTTLVARGVSESAIREMGAEVHSIFDDVLREHAPPVTADERAGLLTFFEEHVLDDFLASRLWERIRNAERVTVEKPIDGLVRLDEVDVEIHGRIDFVVESPAGGLYVTDAKIALAEPTDETIRRYELQVAAYGYLLRQVGSSPRVSRTVETFGVARKTVTTSWPPDIVERRLAGLLYD